MILRALSEGGRFTFISVLIFWAAAGCGLETRAQNLGCTIDSVSVESGECSSTGAPKRSGSQPAGGSLIPSSMKGASLYCWKEKGQWYYSIVAGTNALPERSKVQASKVSDFQKLEKALEGIPGGTEVFMNGVQVPGLALSSPPSTQIEKIRGACEKRGLKLVVGPR